MNGVPPKKNLINFLSDWITQFWNGTLVGDNTMSWWDKVGRASKPSESMLAQGVLTCPFLSLSGTSKVNLVKISSTASSPRDTALAAVICSALATVLLALLILCVIYCKKQFMEKKPSCKSAPSSPSYCELGLWALSHKSSQETWVRQVSPAI